MNILAVNISHDTSIALLQNGNLKWYHEEKDSLGLEEFSIKFPLPENFELKSIRDNVVQKPDFVIYSSYDRSFPDGTNLEDEQIIQKIQTQLDNPKYLFFPKNHHIYHAFNSFRLSNFEDALCVILDGGGSQIVPTFQEIESVYYLNKEDCTCFYQHLTNMRFATQTTLLTNRINKSLDGVDLQLSSEMSSGNDFASFILYYRALKKYDSNISIKQTFKEIMELYDKGDVNGSKLEDKIKRLHFKTRHNTVNFIENALKYKNTKNIILSGGYALNRINNQEYSKFFPESNFFFDPLAHDGGTAPGAAYWLDFQLNIKRLSFDELKAKEKDYIV
jgi:carbamoyltransferase